MPDVVVVLWWWLRVNACWFVVFVLVYFHLLH